VSFFKTLKEKVLTTRNSFIGKIAEVLSIRTKIDEDLMAELEDVLLQADVGPAQAFQIIDELRDKIRLNSVVEVNKVQDLLLTIISDNLISDYEVEKSFYDIELHNPTIMLIIGVNGAGKTTSIGKIANQFKQKGKSVMLIAADTFRAAAIEQLTIWANKADIDIFIKETGSDPSSVIYEGLNFAKSKQIDIVLIDTAGRQHNKENLMCELEKIFKTIKKIFPEAPHECLLVLDATTGQNAISQAHFFHKIAPSSGIILTKFDGTAKGGIVVAVKKQLNIPVKLIGVGEKIEDLQEFNAKEFAKAFFTK
jgi:fused signal recognition particle receptor